MFMFKTKPESGKQSMFGLGLSHKVLGDLKDGIPVMVNADQFQCEDFSGIDRLALVSGPSEEYLEAKIDRLSKIDERFEGPGVQEVFVFICRDENGNEGIPAYQGPLGTMMLVTGERDRLKELRSVASKFVEDTEMPLGLYRFYGREKLEDFE